MTPAQIDHAKIILDLCRIPLYPHSSDEHERCVAEGKTCASLEDSTASHCDAGPVINVYLALPDSFLCTSWPTLFNDPTSPCDWSEISEQARRMLTPGTPQESV